MPPMGVYYYANISDGDMAAIVAYLRALEAKPNPQKPVQRGMANWYG